MRQRDLLWFSEADEGDFIGISGATISGVLGDGTRRVVATSDHVAVAIVSAENPLTYPDPVSSFEWFNGSATTADLDDPITPLFQLDQVPLGNHTTNLGDFDWFAYFYIIPVGAARCAYFRAFDLVGSSFESFAAVTIAGLTAIGPTSVYGNITPATTQTVPDPGNTGHTGINGRWLFAGAPAADQAGGDGTIVTWPHEQLGDPTTGAGTGGAPGFVDGTAGPNHGLGDLEFAYTVDVDADLDGNLGTIAGVWIQLLPTAVPDITPVDFDPTSTHTFEATVHVTGVTRQLPAVEAVHRFNATIDLPAGTGDWRAVLVDADGDTVHRMPDVTIGDIVETLNDVTTSSVRIPLRTPAASAIDDREPFPELEVQIWRGNQLRLWGPITAVAVDDDTLTARVADAPWHLGRRHVGQLGNEFGGKPPYYHDPAVNLRFATGNIDGWSVLRTISIGEFVGFGTPHPAAITVDPTRRLPSGESAVRCHAEADPLDNYQLYQDLAVVPPQNGRELRMTLSGWWYLPTDGGFAPNNQRMGLLLAPLIDDPTLPADYYRPYDVGFSILDDTCPRGQWFYQECQVDVPAGAVPRLVHVAVCFPQGISYVAGLDLQVDDGLLYDESPSTMGAGLVMHAQDPAFDRDDVNIDWWANTIGDREVREYRFADHTNILDAIGALAREGWFDWWCSYTATTRVMNFQARRRGNHQTRCRVHVIDGGASNVAAISKARTVGATSVAAQSRSRDTGNHEHANHTSGLTLEEIFVADREPADYDLPALADQRTLLTTRPHALTVTTHTGDERFLTSIQVGDTTDITSTQPGALADGVYRLTRRTTTPTRDACELEFNPEPPS